MTGQLREQRLGSSAPCSTSRSSTDLRDLREPVARTAGPRHRIVFAFDLRHAAQQSRPASCRTRRDSR